MPKETRENLWQLKKKFIGKTKPNEDTKRILLNQQKALHHNNCSNDAFVDGLVFLSLSTILRRKWKEISKDKIYEYFYTFHLKM